MKCLILAGGSGDRLWPLSRKNYPKQFMEINENRSLLQETIVQNLPFCEEFFIITAESCRYVLEGQLKAFQGLCCRSFYEQEGRKTAGAIAIACMLQNPTELMYVVSADTLVSGPGYPEAVLRAKEMAKAGALAAFGIPVTSANTAYGYIRHDGEQVLSFTEKPDADTAAAYAADGNYLWNSGNFVFRVDTFLRELARLWPEGYEACRQTVAKIRHMADTDVVILREWLQTIPRLSVEKAVFEHSDKVRVVESTFDWKDIGALEDLENVPIHTASRNILENACEDVTVINRSSERLVVANELSHLMIVNTEDATYIGRKGASDSLKEIVRTQTKEVQDYFDNNRVKYRSYGKYEVLSAAPGYQVKKVTIFPGGTISLHRHCHRSEHWSIVEGSAQITLWPEAALQYDGQDAESGKEWARIAADPERAVSRRYEKNESVYVPVGVPHVVTNPTEKDLVIIEVGIGQTVKEEDIIRYEMRKKPRVPEAAEPFVKLAPVFKDYLWGGARLKEHFGKQSDLERIAESWELSAHEAGQSVVADGRHRGMRFGTYLQRIGKAAWGWKCQAMDRFPILVKFLDAHMDLSIQVHPDDEYALVHEQEYGKNEFWYILEAKENAAVYRGFTHSISKEEVRRRVADGTLPEVLERVPVKAGDAVFIPAGTVHAIQSGVVVCEIQQNSDSTYRLYDYNRKDAYGNMRALHVDKALDVLNLQGEKAGAGEQKMRHPESAAQSGEDVTQTGWQQLDGFRRRVIGSCKYFESVCVEVAAQARVEMDESSFVSVLAVDGSGTLRVGEKEAALAKGDSFFVPAGRRTIYIEGTCTCILTRV